MRYLGLDLGTKTLGLALSDKLGIVASFYKNITYKDIDIIHHASAIMDIGNEDRADIHDVLFEETAEEFAVGHTPNYLKVYVKSGELHNQILPVALKEPFRDGMLGEFL